MQAYTAIRRQDRAAVTAGADRAVTVITWVPTTEAGTAVVYALTGQWR
jgi:membrane protein required for beta-lactamase induction